jgi:putative nucleotidyltransferase with HDIG domain
MVSICFESTWWYIENVNNFSVPPEVSSVTEALEKAGYEAYLVGGCVRDLVLNRKPKDWDVTTNATPEDITRVFPNSFYNNTFGTVGVPTESGEESTQVIEITPYRTEGEYTDSRRPESVRFGQSLEEDLKRRDFTINAIAYNVSEDALVDPYKGQEDIKDKTIRAVGNPHERFSEDALRILRAIRLYTELNFSIEPTTEAALSDAKGGLSNISRERIRDEFIRILNSNRPMDGIIYAQKLGILTYIIPDLERGIGIEQNQAHKFDVYGHLLRAMQHAADKGWDFDLRLAGLLHDISKPETRRWSDEKKDWTFHGHEVVGARVAKRILDDLKLPKKQSEKIVKLVRWHMFFSDPDKITLSAVRRIIRNVGEENIWDLLNLRICDRIGTGRPKEQPFRFRKYKAMVEEALRDPISVQMLKIDGGKIMQVTGEEAGPRLGWMLHALLEIVLEDPSQNAAEILEAKVLELSKYSDLELRELGEQGRAKKELKEEEDIREIQKRNWVE